MSGRYFAFFDFDGTLTMTDTVLPFCRYVARRKGFPFWIRLLRQSPYLIGYLLGLVSNLTAKEKLFAVFLAGLRLPEIEILATDFAQLELPKFLRKEGMQKLHYHREQGYCCVLVSASLVLYLLPWAKQQGFEEVLATELEVLGEQLTGRVAGENCLADVKVQRIEAKWGVDCWLSSYAYSDSLVDTPLLRKAEYGFLLRNGYFVPFE